MIYNEEIPEWKPNLTISEIFDISTFKEKIFYIDLILTGNNGYHVLNNIANYPDSAQEWLSNKNPIKLSDGYSSIIMDEFTCRIFLHKDSTQRCSDNFRKIYPIRESISKDLKGY